MAVLIDWNLSRLQFFRVVVNLDLLISNLQMFYYAIF